LNTSITPEEPEPWSLEITPRIGLLDLQLAEVWRYRDLIMLFVRRDLVSAYKQTILGPLWFVLQPLFTTIAYVVVFTRIAGISTNGVPPALFYLSGLVCWNYFSSSLTKTSGSLVANSGIFGKVYFPRLVVPVSGIISNLVTFGAQLGLFIILYLFYLITAPEVVKPNFAVLLLPVLLLLISGMGMGLGMIVSALTTRYRDLQYFLGFGVQLLMYATPIFYPLSIVPETYRFLVLLNPMTPLVELFRYSCLGAGIFSWVLLGYSTLFTLIVVFIGIVAYNQVQRTFMDTV
jgi:lipopolysaccharide transport system permease protein